MKPLKVLLSILFFITIMVTTSVYAFEDPCPGDALVTTSHEWRNGELVIIITCYYEIGDEQCGGSCNPEEG